MTVNNPLRQPNTNIQNQIQQPPQQQLDNTVRLQPVVSGKISNADFDRLELKDKSFMDAIMTVLNDQNIPIESLGKVSIKGIPENDELKELKNPATGKSLKYSEEHPTKKGEVAKKKDIKVESYKRKGVDCAKFPLKVELTINENGATRKISFEKNYFTNLRIPENVDLDSREFGDFKDKINSMIIGLRDEIRTPLALQDKAAIQTLIQNKSTFFHFTRSPNLFTNPSNTVRFRGRVTRWTGLQDSSPKLLGSITKVSTMSGNYMNDVDLQTLKSTKWGQSSLARIQAQPIKLVGCDKLEKGLRNIQSVPDELKGTVTDQSNQEVTRFSDYAKYATNEAITSINEMSEILKKFAHINRKGDFETFAKTYQDRLDRLEKKGSLAAEETESKVKKVLITLTRDPPGMIAQYQYLPVQLQKWQDQKKVLEDRQQLQPLDENELKELNSLKSAIDGYPTQRKNFKERLQTSLIDWLEGDIKFFLDKSIEKYTKCTEALTNLLNPESGHPEALDGTARAQITKLQAIQKQFNAEQLLKNSNAFNDHLTQELVRYKDILEGRTTPPNIQLQPNQQPNQPPPPPPPQNQQPPLVDGH